MKLKYLLPFLFLFNTQDIRAQFKAESNLQELDVKSKYVDVTARDTFGLKDGYNLKGIIKLKYANNSVYLNRNGLLNHSYGINIGLDLAEGYYNNSQQNIKTENSSSQDSQIGQINTKTTLLNENYTNDFGIKFNYNNYFVSYEDAKNRNKVDGETLVEINDEKDLIKYQFNFNNSSQIYGLGFEYGFFKFIQNRQDENKFNNYLAGVGYSGLNVYYGEEIAGFFNFNAFDKVDFNLTYDKNFKLNISTSDYSKLAQKDFERTLENKLRLAPRFYDSGLETSRSYLEDMFFTDDFNFSIDKKSITANLNLGYILFHYLEDNKNFRYSKKIGLKYKFALVTYDFNQKEAKLGVFFN
jgi:hypothetical protein